MPALSQAHVSPSTTLADLLPLPDALRGAAPCGIPPGSSILSNDVLSGVSCRRTHRNEMQWYAREHLLGRAYVSQATLEERLFGIAAEFGKDPDRCATHAATFGAFLGEVPPSRIVGRDWEVLVKLAEARANPILRNLYLSAGGVSGPKIGTDIIVAVQAHVHGLVVATSSVDRFLAIHRELPLPGIYDPKTDIRHL